RYQAADDVVEDLQHLAAEPDRCPSLDAPMLTQTPRPLNARFSPQLAVSPQRSPIRANISTVIAAAEAAPVETKRPPSDRTPKPSPPEASEGRVDAPSGVPGYLV